MDWMNGDENDDAIIAPNLETDNDRKNNTFS